ncbi:MAG: Fur family transcriptional regulator [Oscillospiraceae bacterium]
MGNPRMYKTKQRDLIMQTLRAIPQRHITAEDLAALLHENGEEVGLATVYRNLDKLVNEGLVLKYALPSGMRACYQYLDDCAEHPFHFHLLCTGCGNISHLECTEADSLIAHLVASHHFQINRQKTVFYGLCRQCAEKQQAGGQAGPSN